MNTLIIVDCQNDFISGTISVPKSKQCLDKIKDFIRNNRKDINKIIFTVDWHPHNHMSFKKNGGKFPTHCVQFTPGACIEPKLLKLVQSFNIPYEVSLKGEIEEIEDHGAFSEIEYVSDMLGSRFYLDSIVEADADTTFIVCGIDVHENMQHTLSNLIEGEIVPNIFLDGVVSTNNTHFLCFVSANHIKTI